ncbi:MAG: alkaline phosphatase, partial [Chloroflexota bacterium]|nr:alkaline phosphatase [Chloroflexota bacterium]
TSYYSYDLGTWHIVVLNTNANCKDVPCSTGSAQERWLRADLAAHPAACTLAYWHHPLFSSGPYPGSEPEVRPLWQALYEHGAEAVLNGHAHKYERYAPQDPNGAVDAIRGIREFVVGTGGSELHPIETLARNVEAWDDNTHGVLQLTLRPTGYDWRFLPVAGRTFTDSGSGNCH